MKLIIRQNLRKFYFFLRDIFILPLLNKKFNYFFRSKNNYIFFSELITSKNELNNLCNKFGSDKGGNKEINPSKRKILGNYSTFYDYLLSPHKKNFKLIFEVGIGTNNLDVPSNMGKYGKPGASLKMWRNYFKTAKIYGADIDKRILFSSNRIKTFYVNQYSKKSIKKMWLNINKKNFDLIIDDGIHDFKGNRIFFENSISYLKYGGYYIIEDVNDIYVEQFRNYFSKLNYDVQIIDIFTKENSYSNRIILIKKN